MRWAEPSLEDLCVLEPDWWEKESGGENGGIEVWLVIGQRSRVERALAAAAALLDMATRLTDLPPGDACSQATLDRGHHLLGSIIRVAHDFFSDEIPLPAVGPAGRGSLDLHWRLADRSLLVNIPDEADQPIAYYGRSEAGGTLSGELRGDFLAHIATWLAR